MPEWIYLPRNPVAQLHDPLTQDLYLPRDNNVIHHIPFTAVEWQNVLNYSNTTYLNANHEVWGQIVGYRIKTDMRLILKLYYTGDDKTFSADDPMVFPKQIDLKQYFDWFLFDLDHTLKQEYVIDIVIDGDSVAIAPLEGLNVADWDDGGFL
jgi:hypothetical protein